MKRILIVEDDQLVANVYRNRFAVEGFDAEVAPDGASALEILRKLHPDVMLLDLVLPELSGVEVIQRIRADQEFKDLPIVVFTNTYLTSMVQQAWKAGATKCLSKASCTPKQVIEVIRTTLGLNAAIGKPPAAAPSAAPQKPGTRPTGAEPTVGSPAGNRPVVTPADPRKILLDTSPALLAGLRSLLQAMVKAENEPKRTRQAKELHRSMHGVTGAAAVAGLALIARLSDALEALLKELYEKPKTINVSTLRTVASALDFLGVLFEHAETTGKMTGSIPAVLVVDDEPISRRALTHALGRINLKPVSVDDPGRAYQLLSEQRFDLIFLDVDMPRMSGFELCSKLRQLPGYAKTPVVFVTGLDTLESRAHSSTSGGNDFIAKPFLFLEVAVKSLIYTFRSQLPARR